MDVISPQAALSAARRAFDEGRLQQARSHLLALDGIGSATAASHHLMALVERRLGRVEDSLSAFKAAIALAPDDPLILNDFGQLLGEIGDESSALAAYERALALAPDFWGAALNKAISLYRLQRYSEARTFLHALAPANPGDGTMWNLLGFLERDIGNAAAAAEAFDKALELDPDDPTALKARARVALERAESDVLGRYARALAAVPGDPRLILEQTEARLGQGETDAIDAFVRVAEQWPQWTEGQIALARMRWENVSDEDFAGPVRLLLRQQPGRRDLWRAFVDLLAGCGHYEAAADAARDAGRATGIDPEWLLLEAVHAGRAGDLSRADALFARLPPRLPGRPLHDSVHHIRQGKLDLALASIEAALAENDSDIGTWGVAELVYRKLGDPRAAWLSGQPGLVGTIDLALSPERLEAIRALLRHLHRTGFRMLEQSVRSGTQTRWRLLDRAEPELADLRQALVQSIADYVAGLPPADERHPLLRHRDAPLAITGSWSVLLTGSGHHVSHIHPLGLISSASYFEVPEAAGAAGEGYLELGRPPADLMLDLEPLHVIAPKPGRLVLFPSYVHHGTTMFTAGERLSVAFDVARDLGSPVPA